MNLIESIKQDEASGLHQVIIDLVRLADCFAYAIEDGVPGLAGLDFFYKETFNLFFRDGYKPRKKTIELLLSSENKIVAEYLTDKLESMKGQANEPD